MVPTYIMSKLVDVSLSQFLCFLLVHHVVSCCFACFIVFSFSLLEAIALEEEEMSFQSVPLVQDSKKNHSL